MAFGISFGSNKQKGSSSTTVNKTESTDQTQSGTQTTSGVTQSTGTQSTTSTQAGTSTQSGASNVSTTGTQSSQQSSTQFSEPVLSSLENTVKALLGTLPGSPSQMGGDFNREQFVSGGVEAASTAINSDLEASLNSMFDQFGGRDDSNSMATLLANRARSDAAAQLAGVRSQLEGQGQEIERNRFLANLQGIGQQESFLTQVLDALKGGRAATTGEVQTAEQQAGTTSQTGATTQTGTETTQMSQTQIQNVIEQLMQRLTGTTTTTGTESTTSKGKTSGFGLGLSF